MKKLAEDEAMLFQGDLREVSERAEIELGMLNSLSTPTVVILSTP